MAYKYKCIDIGLPVQMVAVAVVTTIFMFIAHKKLETKKRITIVISRVFKANWCVDLLAEDQF